jgi:hypothetical protein
MDHNPTRRRLLKAAGAAAVAAAGGTWGELQAQTGSV